MSGTSHNASASSGIAERINYRDWDRVASDLEQSVQLQDEVEKENASKALGLDGKYARSQSEAQEREKAQQVQEAKQKLEQYQRREAAVVQDCRGVLEAHGLTRKNGGAPTIVRMTRANLDAGKRVLALSDTSGNDKDTETNGVGDDKIILTQDLSLLESKLDNSATATNAHPSKSSPRSVFGLIKVFLRNMHHCTVVIRCKIITGTVEISHCSHLVVRIEQDATVATMQVDVCHDVEVQFVDAPSGTNVPSLHSQRPSRYWGDDANDRVFHAGVENMKISMWRDGFVERETTVDHIRDGAVAVGNATPEEYQFVTSVVDGDFVTEKVVRHGATTGKNSRPMTERELKQEQIKRDQAVDMVLEKAIRFQEKNPSTSKSSVQTVEDNKKDEGREVEEVYTSTCKEEINAIVADCDANKTRGNEAFTAGEYAQAILLYSLALDKADELPESKTLLFPCHIVLSNRSAAFLKMGEHEKALADATHAQSLDPTYVKAMFRKGLALHAMGRYQEAIPALAEAQKIEPRNKQIQQALQFAEVRLAQEMRKRMDQ